LNPPLATIRAVCWTAGTVAAGGLLANPKQPWCAACKRANPQSMGIRAAMLG